VYVQEAEAKGENYERVKLLEIGADDAEKWERKKKKKNPDPGFSGNFQSAMTFSNKTKCHLP
jgi:hypothetical protein